MCSSLSSPCLLPESVAGILSSLFNDSNELQRQVDLKLASMARLNSQLEEMRSTLNAEIDNVRQENGNFRQEIAELKTAIDENHSLETTGLLNLERTSLDAEIDNLRQENETLRREAEELKTAIDAVLNQSNWMVENQSLKSTLDLLKLEKTSLEAEVKKLTNQVANFQIELSTAKCVTENLTKQNAATISALERQMQQTKSILKDEKIVLELSAKNLETRIRILESKLAEAREATEKAEEAHEAQVNQLANILAEKETEIESLKQQNYYLNMLKNKKV